jgi:hypothetical protein
MLPVNEADADDVDGLHAAPNAQTFLAHVSDEELSTAAKTIARNADKEKGTGPSGFTYQILSLMLADKRCLRALSELVTRALSGKISEQSMDILFAGKITCLPKPDHSLNDPKFRPVTCSEPLAALIEIIACNRFPCQEDLVDKRQAGVGSQRTGEMLVHSVRQQLEGKAGARCPHSLVCLDVSNAFGSASRSHILRAISKRPELNHLYPFIYKRLTHKTPLYTRNDEGRFVLVSKATSGVPQGDNCLLSCTLCIYVMMFWHISRTMTHVSLSLMRMI